jgi:integrase
VLHHHRILRQALKQAVKWRLIAFDPTDAVRAPTPQAKKPETLDEAQTAAFLEGAEGTSLCLPILLAVTTGLRRGEVLALRWKHIDLDRSTLSVVESLEETKDGGLQFKTPKTKGSCRRVTLPSITVEALKRHKVEQAQIRLRLGLGRDDDALVYGRIDGSPKSPRAFTKEFTRLVVKLRAETREHPKEPDIPPVTFHGLRHSHATQLLKAGIHPKIAQERLGHSTIAVTLDLYSHVTETMQEDAARMVDNALRVAINERTNREQ